MRSIQNDLCGILFCMHKAWWVGIGLVLVVAGGLLMLVGKRLGMWGMRDDRLLVVLDAGHGGRDPGAIYDGVYEADVNLAVMKRVLEMIETDDCLDVRATRTLDITVSLEDRIETANEADAALYLSIQSNASSCLSATGVETLVSEQVASDAPAWQFAEILQDAVVTATRARDRGVRDQDLYLHRAKMPAALIEVGFLSNNAERAKLLDAEYQNIIAGAIYEGILRYLAYADPSFSCE